MSQTKYTVLREHEGDRFYKKGETRELDRADARHLVELGVLSPAEIDGGPLAQKREPPPLNKAEKAAANNKSTES